MRLRPRRPLVLPKGSGRPSRAPRPGPTRKLSVPRPALALLGAGISWIVLAPSPVEAHGEAPGEPTSRLLTEGWSFEVDVWVPVLLAALLYWKAWDTVRRRHPANPHPRWRLWSWLAGLLAIVLALASPIELYDTTLFSVHMLQHLLLTMLAAPLLVLAAPVTLLLRVSSPGTRRGRILPVLHSRPVRIVSHPLVAWSLFALVMWFSHFSPLFDAALEDELVHRFEHALYLGSALLFWWPVAGADPSPHRMGYPARLLYLALGMPLSSFLGLVIFSAQTVLYPHYATISRDWGWSALEDQSWAGGIMWAGGDIAFVVALVATVAAWLQNEEREGHREDFRLARQRAARERARRPADAEP